MTPFDSRTRDKAAEVADESGTNARLRISRDDYAAGWNAACDHIAAAIRALPAASQGGWMPIETAPKDGRMIIVPGGIAYWRGGGYGAGDGWHSLTGIDRPGRLIVWDVKCWMPFPDSPAPPLPLPPPPSQEGDAG